jgi:serine/threonine-protein kinase
VTPRTLGHYRIVERLGSGGMGTVYRAIDQMLEREVTIKVLRPDLAGNPDLEARFREEALTLARLHRPNIAFLYALEREGDELFMVMEYIPGDSLATILARSVAIEALTAADWCSQVLDAVEHAHQKGVVHRDIKPANLVLTPDGEVKVLDFGVARVLGTARQTRAGGIVGTVAYMSPEQVQGKDVDGRTDVYAVGIVLYEMLTGRLPFDAADEFTLMRAQVEQIPDPPSRWRPTVPPWLDAAVLKALAKRPEDRFQTAREFREALRAGLRASGASVDRGESARGALQPSGRRDEGTDPAAGVKATRCADEPPTDATATRPSGEPPDEVKATRLPGEPEAPTSSLVSSIRKLLRH